MAPCLIRWQSRDKNDKWAFVLLLETSGYPLYPAPNDYSGLTKKTSNEQMSSHWKSHHYCFAPEQVQPAQVLPVQILEPKSPSWRTHKLSQTLIYMPPKLCWSTLWIWVKIFLNWEGFVEQTQHHPCSKLIFVFWTPVYTFLILIPKCQNTARKELRILQLVSNLKTAEKS